jgi:hypothetical protein
MPKIWIRSLDQLRNWVNQNSSRIWPDQDENWNQKHPTPPILMEWWLDWFFEASREEAIESIELVVAFTMICEGLSTQQARNRTIFNLAFWQDRASYPKEECYYRIGQVSVDWACKEEH